MKIGVPVFAESYSEQNEMKERECVLYTEQETYSVS